MQKMYAKSLFFLALSIGFLASTPAHAADTNKQETITFRDAKLYLETIKQATRLNLEEQQALWKNFLVQYPDSTFREEIEANMRQVKQLQSNGGTNDKPKISDEEVLIRAKDYIRIKKLSLTDQWLLWKQFLQDNPKNKYQDEVKGMMQELAYEIKRQKKTGAAKP